MNFEEIVKKVKELYPPPGEYALFGSVPLAAHGIRESHDIDMIVTPELYERLKTTPGWHEADIPRHPRLITNGVFECDMNWNYGEYLPDPKRLINEAEMIDGVAVVRLSEVLEWKLAFARPKDIKDVELIRLALAKSK